MDDAVGLKAVDFFENEKLLSDDLKMLSEFTYKNASDLLYSTCAKPTTDIVLNGLNLVWDSALSCHLTAGEALGIGGRYFSDVGVWSYVVDASGKYIVFLPADTPLTFAAGGSQQRVDIVEIRPIRQELRTVVRDFKDPVTEIISPIEVPINVIFAADAHIKQGTAGDAPPTRDAGYIKLAEVTIPISASAINQSNIIDIRAASTWATQPSLTKTARAAFKGAFGSADETLDDAVDIPLGAALDFSINPTGGTASSITAVTSLWACVQLLYQRLIDLSGVQNNAVKSRHLTAADVLSTLETVDGPGSGLDADLLDGEQGQTYIQKANQWNSGYTYAVNDPVFRLGKLYISLTINTNADPATDVGTNWLLFKSGGSGGIQYILNPDGESLPSVANWNRYADAAGTVPVDGTGGSPNITFALNSTTPLFGLHDFILTKDTANRQGEGVSTDFIIDRAAVGSALSLDFYYKVSANFADNDLGVYVYDVTNGILISPTTVNLIAAGGSIVRSSLSFNPTTSLSYRLIFHIQSTNALAWTFEVDNIQVGPKTGITTPAITQFTNSYVPTIGATTTPPTKGTTSIDIAKWRRVGGNAEFYYNYLQSVAGSAGSGTYLFTLPPNMSVDISQLPGGINQPVGICSLSNNADDVTDASMNGQVWINSLGQIYFTAINVTNATNSIGGWGSTAYALSGAIVRIKAHFTVPIAQFTTDINLRSQVTEYAYNTSTTAANDTTSFGYGIGGGLFPNITSAGVNYSKRVRFLTPSQPGDLPEFEIFDPGAPVWIKGGLRGFNFVVANTNAYGVRVVPVNGSTTDFDVVFQGGGASAANAATYGANGNDLFSNYFAAGWKYRLKRVSNGNMAEVPQPLSTFRNKIINGNFDIWQRGTTLAIATGNTKYLADRWGTDVQGTSAATTYSQQLFTLGQSLVPNNPKYYARNVITNGGDATNGKIVLFHPIEDVTVLSGRTVTLSFWAQSDAIRPIAISIGQVFGSGGSPSASVNTFVAKLNLSTGWQKYTVIFTVPNIVGKTLGTDPNTSLLSLRFWMSAGSASNTETSTLGIQTGTFDIAQVQLEDNIVATNFEVRPISVEKPLCQRYCQVLDITGAASTMGYGLAATTTTANIGINMKASMRVIPVASLASIANWNLSDTQTATAITALASVASISSKDLLNLSVTVASGLTQFRPYRLETLNASATPLVLDADF